MIYSFANTDNIGNSIGNDKDKDLTPSSSRLRKKT